MVKQTTNIYLTNVIGWEIDQFRLAICLTNVIGWKLNQLELVKTSIGGTCLAAIPNPQPFYQEDIGYENQQKSI